MQWLEGAWLAQSACLRQCQRFWGCGDCGAAVKPHPNLDFDGSGNRLIPARDFFLEKEAKARAVLGLAEPVHPLPHLPRQAACLGGVSVCIPYAAGAACPSCTVRHARTRLWPCASAQGAAPRGAVMRCGRQMRWFRRARWRKRHPACEDGGRYAAVVPAGVVGASRRRRTAIEERFLGLRSLRRCG